MPARVEPVKDIMSDVGMMRHRLADRRAVAVDEVEHAAGTPASCITWANKRPLSGAISDGFSTMVQPAAMAGATLAAIWLIGQFHGVIMPTTPTGS